VRLSLPVNLLLSSAISAVVRLMSMARELHYTVLDVFAERPLEGNPLAVFHDARGLTGEQMQSIAREMRLSETTFVLPEDAADERADGVRVRIFTTEEELPFAGHPTLGTASWLHGYYAPVQGAETVTLRLGVGPIPVTFTPARSDAGQRDADGVFGTMRQNDPVFGEEYSAEEIAAVIGVEAGDLLPGYRPQVVSTGNPFCIVALRSVEVLERLAIPQREATAWLRARGVRWFYCIAPAAAPEASGAPVWRARMQWYAGEDPATGSAAGPCIAWLVRVGLAASGQRVVLRQGVEMQRPSRLEVQAAWGGQTQETLSAGGPRKVSSILVSGRTIPVAEGRLFLP
jgi:trans-2,3-dihydro-3-hydroxyanthranilate isomerase